MEMRLKAAVCFIIVSAIFQYAVANSNVEVDQHPKLHLEASSIYVSESYEMLHVVGKSVHVFIVCSGI